MRRILARLPESSRSRRGATSRAGTAVSVVAHTALVTLAVVATGRSSIDARPRPVDEHPVVYTVLPDDPPAPSSRGPRSAGGPTTRPATPLPPSRPFTPPVVDVVDVVDVAARGAVVIGERWTSSSGMVGGRAGDGGSGGDGAGGGTYDARGVEVEAALRPGAPVPRYPESLRSERIEGRVVARFVVDTTGRVEPASVRIVASEHPLFTSAVRATLPSLRFTPARAHGAKVRQLVELPFEFSIER